METTSPKFFCFVLMPFNKAFDDIYQLGIKESCKEVGAYCERVDEQLFEERMTDRIYNQIAKADLIIADMTGKNPNVFYEVGYAHALNKPTILLTQKSDDIPFDLKDYPHIIYDGSIQKIKSDLPKRIEWYMENRNEKSVIKNDFEILVDGNVIDNKTYIVRKIPFRSFSFTIHNKSLKHYSKDHYQVAILYEGLFYKDFNMSANHRSTYLSSDKRLNILPTEHPIYPNGYETINLIPNLKLDYNKESILEFEVIIYTQTNENRFKFSVKIETNPDYYDI